MKPTPLIAKGFENTYEPAEDSFFLLDCLEKDESFLQAFSDENSPLIIAELGTGTGVVSSFIPHSLPSKYVPIASDINPAACECALKTWDLNWSASSHGKISLQVVRGDLLNWIRPKTIDVLVFNPPYVPSPNVPQIPYNNSENDDLTDDKWVDLALDGGEEGMEITKVVLDQLDQKLSPKGVAYILFCASNHPQRVCEHMKTRGWIYCHIDTRRAGWEILSVYRFSRS